MEPSKSSSDLHLFLTEKLSSLTVKKGKLTKKTPLDWVKHTLYKKAEVEQKLLQVIKKLGTTTTSAKDVKKLFTKVIPQLKNPDFIYSLRLFATKEQKEHLQKIENILNPELGKLREEKKTSQATKEDPDQKVARRIEKAKLAMLLGIHSDANKGATGTVLLRSASGKILGVFKPVHADTPVITRIKDFFKRKFKGQLYYLPKGSAAQSKAEVAAYELDKYFKFGLTPASKMVEIGDKKGAFQFFLDGFQDAKNIIGKLESKEKQFEKEELLQFQKLAVFDYLIGNLDRHNENWFIPKDSDKALNIRAIDNANSFLAKNPKSPTKIANQYAWKNLQIAEKPFSPEMREFMKGLSEEEIRGFIKEYQLKDPENSLFFNERIIENLINRAAVLREIAAKEGSTPQLLAKIITTNQIAKAGDGQFPE